MAVSRANVWIANEILTAAELNAEFDNILNAGESVGWPRTGAVATNLAGNILGLDADADTTLRSSTDDVIDIAIGGTDTYQFTASAMTILGRRVLTTSDRNELMTEAMRARTTEARVTELEANGLLMAQLNNF